MLLVFCNCSLYDSSHAFMKLFQISVDSRDKRSEREVILTISGRKPTRECGFCATPAARGIKSRIAWGYEYTEVLRTFRRKIPARRSPTQNISPKKLSKTYPGGQKKPGKKPVFLVILISCYPVNPVMSGLYYLVYWGYMDNWPKHQHPGGASGFFLVLPVRGFIPGP